MTKTNVWRSRTVAGIDVTTDLAEDRVYEGICDAAEGGLRSAFDGIDEDTVIVSSRLVHSKTQ